MKKLRIISVVLTLAMTLGAGVAVAADSTDALSLDTPWRCTAGNPVSNTADKSEGVASMQFRASGYSLCTSPAMVCKDFSHLSNEILVDVKLPQNLPNPWWVGDVSMYVEIPSLNVYNSWVGNVMLTGLPLNEWVTVSIPATSTMLYALGGTCNDAVIRFALNTSAVNVLVDNIRFAGDEPPVEMVLTITEDGDDGQFDPSTTIIPSGWSAQGEGGNTLYTGSHNTADWGGLGNGLTTTAYRFTLTEDIPAGADISDARLSLYGLGEWSWDSNVDALQIAVELSSDAEPISGLADMPLAAGGREIVPITVRWPETGGLAWQYPGWNESVNIASLLEELVDTVDGLEAGAHVQFYVYGDVANINSEVVVEDSSHAGANHPTLTVVLD